MDITPEMRAQGRALAEEVLRLRAEVQALRVRVAQQEARVARQHKHILSLEARLCAKRVDEATGFFRKNHRRLLEG